MGETERRIKDNSRVCSELLDKSGGALSLRGKFKRSSVLDVTNLRCLVDTPVMMISRQVGIQIWGSVKRLGMQMQMQIWESLPNIESGHWI